MRSVLARWCLNCGRWIFRCQCRESLPYCDPAVVGDRCVKRER